MRDIAPRRPPTAHSRSRATLATNPRPMHTIAGRLALLLLAVITVYGSSDAQNAPRTQPARGDSARGLPLAGTRTVRFTTDEVTWMSLDVSPDGKTIVFDLLGDLYTVPITGGAATRMTDGMAFDAQPRFSPDGKTIVFASDRSGAENLWLIDSDGRNARALTKGDKGQYISPEWTPDGRYIVTSRSTTDVRASTYELYLYHVDGGSGIKLAGASGSGSSGPQAGAGAPIDNFLGAAFGPDPRYIYVAVKRGGFGYNLQFPLWQVAVYDRETGETHNRTNAFGSAMRPIVSPDGTWLVYATREDSVTSLRIRDISSGDERWLARNVQHDDQESRYTRDNMPGSAFTPDGSALITSWDGRIKRVDIATGAVTDVPFTAEVDQRLAPLVRFDYRVNDSTVTVRQIRGARPSPDGRRLAFTALDRVWVMDLPSGAPRRLTSGNVGEHSPVWSPDGRYIAYVTWAEDGGDIYRMRADGRRGARPERLTTERAFYDRLSYTPNGTRLVAARGPKQPRIEEEGMYGMELVWIRAAGGPAASIAPLTASGWPHFTEDTSRIFITDGRRGLISMRFDGTDVRQVIRVTGYAQPGGGPNARPEPADQILMAPRGDRAIAQVGDNVYLVTVPVVGREGVQVSVLRPDNAPVPVRRITKVGGDFLGWYPDGNRFHYSLGHAYFTYDIARADSLVRDSTARADSLRRAGRAPGAGADSARSDTAQAGAQPGRQVALAGGDSAAVARSDTGKKAAPAYEPARVDVLITVDRDRPRGTIALRGARIVTMKGDEVIENGDILVRDNRIAAVGPAGSLTIPPGTHVVDAAGTTIIPGWIDIHAHLRPAFGIHKTQVWEYLANLAYGVTTTRDPQTGTTDVLTYGDLVETGDILGPRIFSTGPGVFWSENINSLDDARDVLRRYSEYYNTHTIKQYGAGDRKVRQWIIMAAGELGLMPTSENYLDFKKNLTEAMDGYPGAEHSYPIMPLYKDAVELIAKSGITYTPTLLVNFGGPWGENYWYQSYDITTDAKLARWTPKVEIRRRGLRRGGYFHRSQFVLEEQAAQARKIVDAGGRVGLGGHGQLQGLGVHWELWNFALGGMSPHDVLRVGTTFGAEGIGLGKELGSLEAGKLADLQVLDANPLDDIRNTTRIRYVMKNGRLYEAETLTEVWPRRRELPRPWWWGEEECVNGGCGADRE